MGGGHWTRRRSTSALRWFSFALGALSIASGCSKGDDDDGASTGCPLGMVASGTTCVANAQAGSSGSSGAAGSTAGSAGGTAGMAGSTGAAGMMTMTAGTTGAAGMMMTAGTNANTAGNDAMPMAGMAAAGTGATDPGMGSTGCGAADHPADGPQTMDVDGTEREFIVAIPDDYDPSKQYKLIFAWHGLGGMASQIAGGFGGGYYGLQSRAMGSSIFVAGQGLDTSNQVGSGPGWDNMGGRDVAFTRKMLEWLKASYCIDNSRIFSVGMSYGGIMSNTVGCALGDEFRAIAPMSGLGPSAFGGGGACVDQVAAWLSHGNTDTVVQFSSGQGSRDHWVEANHCDATPGAPDANGCVEYPGCDADYPVVWCEFDGGHTVPSFASEEIWKFFSRF